MRSRLPLRTVLLAVQVAVTVVLLTSAGLLLRGVAQARTLDLGFTMDEVGVVTIDLPAFAYDNTRAAALLNELRTAVRDVGLQSFAFTTHEPLSNFHFQTGMRLSSEGEEMTRPVEFIEVTPGYFDVLGLRLMAGRDFQDSDAGRPVAIVNETLARQYWPGQNPVGRSFIGGGRESLEIVGLVKDAYTSRLNGIEPVFFRPFGTRVWSEQFPRLLFRATQPAAWTAVAARISSVEARAVVNVTPLQDRFEDVISQLDFAPMAASILGRAGSDPGHHRHVRRLRVRRPSADPRDRDSHGARRALGRHHPPRAVRKLARGDDRSRRGPRRRHRRLAGASQLRCTG